METPNSNTQNTHITKSSPNQKLSAHESLFDLTIETKYNHIPKEQWCGDEFLYQFHGFWFTKTYLETTIEVVEKFKPLPKDVILASFPKTGTTWLKALLYSITHRSCCLPDEAVFTLNHPQELIPSLETNLYIPKCLPQMQEFMNEKEGRMFSTHASYQILKETLNSCECKIVYVARNPKDTIVSLWHFLKRLEGFEWDLETAVDQFCRGVVPFGPYYEHVLAYWQESVVRPEKVMFVTYEELMESTGKHVRRLGEFLGCPFLGEEGEGEVNRIVESCSFKVLSNREICRSSELSESGFPLPYNAFFRKGEVGDHLRLLGDEMIGKIDDVTREKFYGCGFEYGI